MILKGIIIAMVSAMKLFAIFAFLLFAVAPALCGAEQALTPGTWGGPHLRMEITANGATLEFDCAGATISERIFPDASGRFQVRGTFQAEGHGPTREGRSQPTNNATFTGTVEGDSMQLEIKVEGQNDVQKYTLGKGQQGRLFKCK